MFNPNLSLCGRILIVDDEPSITAMLRKFLEKNNHQAETAASGEEALQKLSTCSFDIVITDFRLPGIDGLRVLEEIKKIDPQIDVIVLTGYGSIESAVEFLKAGAIDYITKPLNCEYLYIVIQKALERKELIKAARERDEYRKQSLTDGLTGVFNHKYFKDQLKRELSNSERTKQHLSVLLLDIDNFKSINDCFGHQVGDTVLKEISDVLSRSCREYDTVARYGGEEFGMILPGTNLQGASRIADRIIRKIASSSYNPVDHSVTASIGISIFPEHAEANDDLFKKADMALYYSKRNGKNRFTVFEEQIEGVPDEGAGQVM